MSSARIDEEVIDDSSIKSIRSQSGQSTSLAAKPSTVMITRGSKTNLRKKLTDLSSAGAIRTIKTWATSTPSPDSVTSDSDKSVIVALPT